MEELPVINAWAEKLFMQKVGTECAFIPSRALLASIHTSSDAEFAGSIFPSSKISRVACRSLSWPGGSVTHLWTAMRKLSHPYNVGPKTFASLVVWNAADACSISPMFGHSLGVFPSFGPRLCQLCTAVTVEARPYLSVPRIQWKNVPWCGGPAHAPSGRWTRQSVDNKRIKKHVSVLGHAF